MTACAWATCKDAATAIAGEWWFCARHHREHEALEAQGDLDDDEPLDDRQILDETAITRRCAGDRAVSLNPAEAFAAFSRLESEGMSASEIADRLGTTSRTVVRWRTGHHDPISLPGVSMTTPTTASGIGLLLEQASAHGNPKVKRLGDKIEGLLSDLRALIKASEADEQARQEIARLERQLAEPKAKLRGSKPASVTSIARPTGESGRTAPMPCRKCGKVCSGGQGRAAHERVCTASVAVTA